MSILLPKTCKRCGLPFLTVQGTESYCSRACRITGKSGRRGCPVRGCLGSLRSSSLVTCHRCWDRTPEDLRTRLSQAWEAYRLAGTSTRTQLFKALEELKEEAIAAAEGRADELEEKRKRRARKRARDRALAA